MGRFAFDFRLPDSIRNLFRILEEAGGRPYLVGGAVRDALLSRPLVDFDVEVYGLAADQLRARLSSIARVEPAGESFAVFKVAGLPGITGQVDVSLPRRDSKRGTGHRGFEVTGDPAMPFEEAVRRRDFTINALLFDPRSNEIVDLVGGRLDLESRLLRVVDPATFGEDSLRVLRGAQFAARFGLRVDAATSELCSSIPLNDLPAERISSEIEKLLLRSPRPSVGFVLLHDWKRLADVAPELLPLEGCLQDPKWHPEGDVWTHTLLAVDRISSVISGERWGDLDPARSWAVALAVLCHDLGKPATTREIDGRWRSLEHEEAGIPPTTSLLDRWNVHTRDGYDVRSQVLGLVANHLKPGQFYDDRERLRDGAFRRLARKCELDLLARVAAADSLGRDGDFSDDAMRWFAGRASELDVATGAPKPILMGRHLLPLGVSAGPLMGRVLAAVFERQLDGTVTDLTSAIREAGQILSETRKTDPNEAS